MKDQYKPYIFSVGDKQQRISKGGCSTVGFKIVLTRQ